MITAKLANSYSRDSETQVAAQVKRLIASAEIAIEAAVDAGRFEATIIEDKDITHRASSIFCTMADDLGYSVMISTVHNTITLSWEHAA